MIVSLLPHLFAHPVEHLVGGLVGELVGDDVGEHVGEHVGLHVGRLVGRNVGRLDLGLRGLRGLECLDFYLHNGSCNLRSKYTKKDYEKSSIFTNEREGKVTKKSCGRSDEHSHYGPMDEEEKSQIASDVWPITAKSSAAERPTEYGWVLC